MSCLSQVSAASESAQVWNRSGSSSFPPGGSGAHALRYFCGAGRPVPESPWLLYQGQTEARSPAFSEANTKFISLPYAKTLTAILTSSLQSTLMPPDVFYSK